PPGAGHRPAHLARQRILMPRPPLFPVFVLLLGASAASGQQLLDRVVARVYQAAITLTDVQAAAGLGTVMSGAGAGLDESGRQMIDRSLVLEEVARFPPPEPERAAVDAEVARYKSYAGDRLGALMQSTGLDEERLRELARDTLRIDAYLDQRFG